jgi:hypothetical protein
LNERVEETGLAYARFMDDWVVLAPTRWKLRKAIRVANQTLAELHIEPHPDKTSIGRISRGFDFLGNAFNPAVLEVARRRSNDAPNGCPSSMSNVWPCSTSGHTFSAGCGGREAVCGTWERDCPSVSWNSSCGRWVGWDG